MRPRSCGRLSLSSCVSQGLHAQANRPVRLQLHDHLIGRSRPFLFFRIAHTIHDFQPVFPYDVIADVGKPLPGKAAQFRPDILLRQRAALTQQLAGGAQPADNSGIFADRRRRRLAFTQQHIAAHSPPFGQNFRNGRRKFTGLRQAGAQLRPLLCRQFCRQAFPQNVHELRIHIHPLSEA